jgi:hypothetical protein
MFISLHNGFHPLLKIRSSLWDFNKKVKIKFQRSEETINNQSSRGTVDFIMTGMSPSTKKTINIQSSSVTAELTIDTK